MFTPILEPHSIRLNPAQFFNGQALAWHIARHYLFSRERQALEWFVTIISVLGVALGVGTVISVFGVVDGMRKQVIGDLVAHIPHLAIINKDQPAQNPDPALLETLRRHPGVAAAEPVLREDAGLFYKDPTDSFQTWSWIYAADRIPRKNIWGVELPEGVDSLPVEPGSLLIGDQMTSMPLIGKKMLILSSRKVRTALFTVPKRKMMRVQGTFKTGDEFFGRHLAFATWRDMRDLTMTTSGITLIHVQLRDPLDVEHVKAQLLPELPPGWQATSWVEDFSRMFGQMRVLKLGMSIVMLMTMLVAALNVIGTLALIVIQKTREIGILRAMGASRHLVGSIFLLEGTLVGLVGSLMGLLLGLGFCTAVKLMKIPMPGQWRFYREIPVDLNPQTIILVMVSSLVICTLAAAAPARRASRLNPVEALRHE